MQATTPSKKLTSVRGELSGHGVSVFPGISYTVLTGGYMARCNNSHKSEHKLDKYLISPAVSCIAIGKARVRQILQNGSIER